MPTVVIIHAAEDTLPARALAEKLRGAQLQVVLEQQPGDELRNAVKDAPVTIALWSPRAVEQAELSEEVSFARGKSKVIHALMQSAPVPDKFRSDKSVNLTGWRGEDDFEPWRQLAKLVTDKAGVSPLPPPTPKPPSGFFQPGRVDASADAAAPAAQAGRGAQRAQPQSRPQPQRAAPQQRAPQAAASERSSGSGGRGMVMAVIALIVIAAAGGGGYWWWSQQQGAQTAATAWEDVDRGSATALRAFIDGEPGEFRDDAQAALADLEQRSYEAAADVDTIESYEAFLNDFPSSEHAIAARGRIAELRTLEPDPNAPPEEAETLTPAEPVDPDLLPPGTTPPSPAPAPADDGPAALTPPPVEDTPTEPGSDPGE